MFMLIFIHQIGTLGGRVLINLVKLLVGSLMIRICVQKTWPIAVTFKRAGTVALASQKSVLNIRNSWKS